MALYDGDTFEHEGRKFVVTFPADEGHGAPWDEHDGHGPVSDWTLRDKEPGEVVLASDQNSYRYYAMRAAVKLALADGWDTIDPPAPKGETKRAKAARAAQADFEYLKGWATDRWHYVGVAVRSVDEPDIRASLWGIEDTEAAYLEEVAHDCAGECLEELRKREQHVLCCVACKGTGKIHV